MSLTAPSVSQRWRCAQCGNLTRFDVTRTRRSRDYVHVDLSGEPRVEESEALSETIEEVRCRWCGSVEAVEVVDRPAAERSAPAESA
ncbi:hypothetical protein [Marinactinospora rubrisoli]|uniref:Uncharacterized protein n=1 Tax=Marinactinospora rubrisoli TaxID=2715399 RepID=A0ABW2KLU6_9ACTN